MDVSRRKEAAGRLALSKWRLGVSVANWFRLAAGCNADPAKNAAGAFLACGWSRTSLGKLV